MKPIIQEITKYLVEGVEYESKEDAISAITLKEVYNHTQSFLSSWELEESAKGELEVYLEDFIKHLVKSGIQFSTGGNL